MGYALLREKAPLGQKTLKPGLQGVNGVLTHCRDWKKYAANDESASGYMYITSDPIGLDGGMNTYLYANANPVRYIDKYGLMSGLPRIPGRGGPSPSTCLRAGETCSSRAQRGIIQCQAMRGLGAGSITCKDEWNNWAIDCFVSGPKRCDEEDENQACSGSSSNDPFDFDFG